MKRLNVTILAGLLAAIIGAALVISYGKNVDQRIAEGEETVPVLVATTNLETGMSSSEVADAVEKREVPRQYAVDGAIEAVSDVEGLTLVAPVPAGTQLSTGFFGTEGEAITLSPEEGNAAVAVQVALPAGVARYIAPGSFVDVFATYDQIQGQEKASYRSKLVLSGVRVLSASVAQAFGTEEEGSEEVSLPTDQVLAVLELTPSQAERVVNVSTLGSIYLALVNEGEEHVTPGGVTPDDVVKGNRQ